MVFDRKLAFGLVLLASAAACSKQGYVPPEPLLPANDTRVEISSGALIGGHSENGAQTWLGIPYAAAPVGDLRWRAPEPAPRWDADRTALNHGSWCPQLGNGWDGLLGVEQDVLHGNEDCLFLDIYAPKENANTEPLPVMVWIHGGSNVWGRAEQYDGSKLAEDGQVVVVVVQYRLGPLGWFAHPALESESANFALLDLVASLKWVRDNIDVFGGNPENVTIFGESAGANNILALLAMPQADGLFQSAIAQSGLPGSTPLALAQNGAGSAVVGALPAAQDFTGREEPDASALRSATLDDIFDAYRGGRIPAVIRDGSTLPDEVLSDAIVQHQAGKNVSIILGSNRDEAKYLLAFDPGMTRKKLGLFPAPKDALHYEAVDAYLSGIWRTLGVTEFAEKLAASSNAPIRTYRFDWDEESNAGLSDTSQLIGAAHSLEIPFVFGHFEDFMGRLDQYLFSEENESGRLELSELMMACWSQFAHNSALDGSQSCPDWPQATAPGDKLTLVFDTAADGGVRTEVDSTTTEDWLDALEVDPVLDDDNRRCELTGQMTGVFALIAPDLKAELESVCQGSR